MFPFDQRPCASLSGLSRNGPCFHRSTLYFYFDCAFLPMAPRYPLRSDVADNAFMILRVPNFISCPSVNRPMMIPQVPRAPGCVGFTVSSVFPLGFVSTFMPPFYYPCILALSCLGLRRFVARLTLASCECIPKPRAFLVSYIVASLRGVG